MVLELCGDNIRTYRHTYRHTYIQTDRQTEPNYYIDKDNDYQLLVEIVEQMTAYGTADTDKKAIISRKGSIREEWKYVGRLRNVDNDRKE